MPAAIRLVIPGAPAPRDTHHKCPYPGCPRTLLRSLPACKRHQKAWQAMKDAANGSAP